MISILKDKNRNNKNCDLRTLNMYHSFYSNIFQKYYYRCERVSIKQNVTNIK